MDSKSRASAPAVTLALSLSLIAGACASGRPDARGPGPGGPAARPPLLFISPAGEAFRGAPGGPPPITLWLAQADSDKDGRLSRDEFLADARAFMARLDADRDGSVTPFETQTYQMANARETLSGFGRGEPIRSEPPPPSGKGRNPRGGGPGSGRPTRYRPRPHGIAVRSMTSWITASVVSPWLAACGPSHRRWAST